MSARPLPATLLHDRMREWWRPLALDLDGGLVERRRRGVEALRASISAEHAADAVAYAHGDELAGQRIIELVRGAARVAEPGYGGRVGDAEPPALVAAALADQLAVEPDSELSTLIALLILSAAHGRHAPAIAEMPLADYAERQLDHAASRSGRNPVDSQWSAARLVAELLKSGSSHAYAPSGYAAAIVALAERVDELAASAERERDALRGELRRQAWGAESWCETAAMPWAELDSAARPLIAAIELADRTTGIVPAPGAAALLRRVITGTAPGFRHGIGDPVAAAAPHLEGRLTVAPHPMLFPIAARLHAWRERGEDDPLAAAPHFEQRGFGRGFGDADGGEDVETAVQAYREALALRALGHD